jgi:hypothetical protein
MPLAPFSLVDGGPLCRLFRRLGCVRPDGQTEYRRAAIMILAVTWGPLIVLALVESLMTGRTPAIDWGIHARLLVATPLLLRAEASLHMRTRRTIDVFTSERWAGEHVDRLTTILATARRLRDAVAPEVILLGLALIGSQAVVWRLGGLRSALRQLTLDPQLIAPRYWYAFIALPVFQFLVYRTLWRWGIWTHLLWRLSRLPLKPIAIHPDLAGGLAFLSIPSAGFAYVIAGLSAAQAGVWANKVLVANAELMSFRPNLLAFTVGAAVVALGPLLAFSGHLWRCRFAAKIDYGDLAIDYTRQFHARRIVQRERDDLMGNADIQSLADLASSCEVITKMRPVPFGPLLVALIAAAALLPMIPLILLRISVVDLLLKVGGAVLGKGPG